MNFSTRFLDFRLDFEDSHNFKKQLKTTIESTINSIFANNPLPVSIDKPDLRRNSVNQVFGNLHNYSTPWFNEYEKLIFESLRFSEYELYQQPFMQIFMISQNDTLYDLDSLRTGASMPVNIYEDIYYTKGIPTFVLVLNDTTEEQPLSNDILFEIRKKYPTFEVITSDINRKKEDESFLDDVWSHYLTIMSKYSGLFDGRKGCMCSVAEYKTFNNLIYDMMTKKVRPFLEDLATKIEVDINENKKGLKNSFLSLFKKADKVEFNKNLGIYKFSDTEKRLHVLLTFQFYMRDYERAYDNLKYLISDVKANSANHAHHLNEKLAILAFLLGKRDYTLIKETYKNIKSSEGSLFALRNVLIQSKMLEHARNNKELKKLLINCCFENEVPILCPLFYEKVSCFYILHDPPNIRKYALYQLLAGSSYKNLHGVFKKYALNNFTNIQSLFMENTDSFSKIKEEISRLIADICSSEGFAGGAAKFYKRCLEISQHNNNTDSQAIFMKNFIHSIMKILLTGHKTVGQEVLSLAVNDASVTVIKADDVTLITKQSNWVAFNQYCALDNKERYCFLSNDDETVLRNLDSVGEHRQIFGNERKVTCLTGQKVMVNFPLENKLSIGLSLGKIKLLCGYDDDDENIEFEETAISLGPNMKTHLSLSFVPNKEGRVFIKGFTFSLYEEAKFDYIFFSKDKKKHIFVEAFENKQKILFDFQPNQVFLYNCMAELKGSVENLSDSKIEAFTVFFEKNSLTVGEFFLFTKKLNKGEKFDFVVPVCPQKIGDLDIKAILKCNDKIILQKIEIKRNILNVTVLPSIEISQLETKFSFEVDKVMHRMNYKLQVVNEYLENLSVSKVYKMNNMEVTYQKAIVLPGRAKSSIFQAVIVENLSEDGKFDKEEECCGVAIRRFKDLANFIIELKGEYKGNEVTMLSFDRIEGKKTRIGNETIVKVLLDKLKVEIEEVAKNGRRFYKLVINVGRFYSFLKVKQITLRRPMESREFLSN